jgi:hypothetical protein
MLALKIDTLACKRHGCMDMCGMRPVCLPLVYQREKNQIYQEAPHPLNPMRRVDTNDELLCL